MKTKAQIISMDFVMTFAIYIFALSIFFFAITGNFSDSTNLDLNAELIFNKLANAPNLETDILDGAKIINLEDFGGDSYKSYNVFFRDFENPKFKKIDYCVFLHNETNILFHFSAYKKIYDNDEENLEEYPIFLGETKCGEGAMKRSNVKPSCKAKESIILEKPVLYEGEIMKLKVLVCAE